MQPVQAPLAASFPRCLCSGLLGSLLTALKSDYFFPHMWTKLPGAAGLKPGLSLFSTGLGHH